MKIAVTYINTEAIEARDRMKAYTYHIETDAGEFDKTICARSEASAYRKLQKALKGEAVYYAELI